MQHCQEKRTEKYPEYEEAKLEGDECCGQLIDKFAQVYLSKSENNVNGRAMTGISWRFKLVVKDKDR